MAAGWRGGAWVREGLGGGSQEAGRLDILDPCQSLIFLVFLPHALKRNMKPNAIDPQSSRAEALRDQEAIRKAGERINESRATARAFLQRAGIITPTGKLRKAYR